MTGIIIMLSTILVLLVAIILLFLLAKAIINRIVKEFFGSESLKELFDNNEIIYNETPKSLSSMEMIYSNDLKNDFPDLNINELKSSSEQYIRDVLNSIESKNTDKLEKISDKLTSYVESKIEDLKDKKIDIDNIKMHKTVVNKYEKKDGIASISFQTSLEYSYKEDNSVRKKIQTRYKTEFIYIIDASKLDKKVKALGINCPNCGAPIKTLGHKHCEYCNTGVVDIVKKTWIINNIKEY